MQMMHFFSKWRCPESKISVTKTHNTTKLCAIIVSSELFVLTIKFWSLNNKISSMAISVSPSDISS